MDKGKFKASLRRRFRLFVRELRDGCVDCIEQRRLCQKCRATATEAAMNPRKYLSAKE